MTYAFTFDASACTGCKACQVACKDRNQLPVGVLWRRVYEVAGGGWLKNGEAWQTDVFACNLSMACNHCIHPRCAGVCPSDAFITRPDGVVKIDGEKCLGCGYCAWACPYGAPQYDPAKGTMSKCTFCVEELDAGMPPACVAACPMRVLNLVVLEDASLPMPGGQALWQVPGADHPFPLPAFSRTQPHLVLQSHPSMGTRQDGLIANREETEPPVIKSEVPLVAFTLLLQAAAGMAILLGIPGLFPSSQAAVLAMGGLLVAGMLSSLLHLGKPWRAWRAIIHLRKSWLSREILATVLFGGGWMALGLAYFLPGTTTGLLQVLHLLAGLLGLGLVYSMTWVYRLHNVPPWDTPRTGLAFACSSLLLGGLALLCLRLLPGGGSGSADPLLCLFVAISVAGAVVLSLVGKRTKHPHLLRLRTAAALLAFGGLVWLQFVVSAGSVLILPVALLALLGEVLGRWLFYARREPGIGSMEARMPGSHASDSLKYR